MRRFISVSIALLLPMVGLLVTARGDDTATGIPDATQQPGATGDAPFPVRSPKPTTTSTPSPTQTSAIGTQEARPLTPVQLRDVLTLVLYERPDETTDSAIDAFLAPGLDSIRLTRDPHSAPFLVDMLGIPPYGMLYRRHIGDSLRQLTGVEAIGTDWFQWVEWVEAHPEYAAPAPYAWWKGEVLSTVDPRFRMFLPEDGVTHTIRLEEIVWGGVHVDAIPSLDKPKTIPLEEAHYLESDEQVFGVYLDGEARAYPLRIMNWHEMANDVLGDQPFTLAYCTLCGSGILYDTRRPAGQEPYTFGSSGLLYRSNKLMYDMGIYNLWNQFTGQPVVGEHVGENVTLPILPVTLTTWAEWSRQHPDTTVLSLETGYDRNYATPGTPGAAYADYFSSPHLMFPGGPGGRDARLGPKSQVFVAVTGTGASKAYPLDLLRGTPVLNDALGETSIVLVSDDGGGVQAYQRGELSFMRDSDGRLVDGAGHEWRSAADGLRGPNGTVYTRVSGHVAYWFGYASFRPDGELYTGR